MKLSKAFSLADSDILNIRELVQRELGSIGGENREVPDGGFVYKTQIGEVEV